MTRPGREQAFAFVIGSLAAWALLYAVAEGLYALVRCIVGAG